MMQCFQPCFADLSGEAAWRLWQARASVFLAEVLSVAPSEAPFSGFPSSALTSWWSSAVWLVFAQDLEAQQVVAEFQCWVEGLSV